MIRVRRLIHHWQGRQVDAEGLAGHCATALGLGAKRIGRGLRQRGENAETAGIRHRRREFCAADPHHAALDDRMLDAEQFGEACADRHFGDIRIAPSRRMVSPLSIGFCKMLSTISANSSRSEEHTSELQSLMRTSYSVFCFNKK